MTNQCSTRHALEARSLRRLLIVSVLVALWTVAQGQVMVMTQVHTVEGAIEVIDPSASGNSDNSDHVTVAAAVRRAYPNGEVLTRHVRITSHMRIGDTFYAGTHYDITPTAARLLVESITAIDEIQASLREYVNQSTSTNTARAELTTTVELSNSADAVSSVDVFRIGPDTHSVPFFSGRALARLPEGERAAAGRRVADELAALIGAALAYLDTIE